MSYNRPMTINCDTNTEVDCAVEVALAIITGKWKLKIYKALIQNDTMRFFEIRNSLSNISEKTLAAQLREMEHDGLLHRTLYPEVPPRVEYSLTPFGNSLASIFEALTNFGKCYITNRESLEI